MKAWRLHEYGAPRDVLRLEEVPIPGARAARAPRARGRDHAQLQRSRRHHRPLSHGAPAPALHPGHGGARARGGRGRGRRRLAGQARVRDPGRRIRRLCRAGGLPRGLRIRDAGRHPGSRKPPRSSSRSISPGSRCSSAGASRAARACSSTRPRAGSVSAAVQLARHAGARVFATAGSDAKLALCRELGADVAINYRKDAFDDARQRGHRRPRRRRRVRLGRRRRDRPVLPLHGVQRAAALAGLRIRDRGRGRSDVHAAPAAVRQLLARRRVLGVHGRSARVPAPDRLQLPLARGRRARAPRGARAACGAGRSAP